MSGDEQRDNGEDAEGNLPTDFTAAELLDLVWANMADVLGTAATATMIRRAIQRARSDEPILDGITIGRGEFDYQYVLSDNWHQKEDKQVWYGLRLLIRELRLLLIEMTGPVVVRRLERIPLVRCLGMALEDET